MLHHLLPAQIVLLKTTPRKAFCIDENGHILLDHTFVGSTYDKEELKASVMAVAFSADEYDDKIVAQWDRQTALDTMRE